VVPERAHWRHIKAALQVVDTLPCSLPCGHGDVSVLVSRTQHYFNRTRILLIGKFLLKKESAIQVIFALRYPFGKPMVRAMDSVIIDDRTNAKAREEQTPYRRYSAKLWHASGVHTYANAS
jgi:hypothetical protein